VSSHLQGRVINPNLNYYYLITMSDAVVYVGVEEFAWELALVAHDWLGRLQGRELGGAVSSQEPGDCGLGKPGLAGDLEARQAHPA